MTKTERLIDIAALSYIADVMPFEAFCNLVETNEDEFLKVVENIEDDSDSKTSIEECVIKIWNHIKNKYK